MSAGTPADDPLSGFIQNDTYLVITRCQDLSSDSDTYTVCGYSPRTGLSYIGKSNSIES